jgi:hypothetical protein
MRTPRIVSASPLERTQLLVRFANGVQKVYDCAPLLRLTAFRTLGNDVFFRQVRVDAGGYGVSWNDEVDLSEYELWTNGSELALVK